MSRVFISQFHIGLGWGKHIKVWHVICDSKMFSSIFMKQHSTYCIKFRGRSNNYSITKNMKVKIQNIIIMLWLKEFQEMIYFIIIHWFYWSGVHIWNIFISILKWILLRVNLNIIITNIMMIKYPYNIRNHRTGFGRRDPWFEGDLWRFAVPLSWRTIWFITMKVIELVHLSSKTWWELVRATDDSGISLVSNYSIELANSLL